MKKVLKSPGKHCTYILNMFTHNSAIRWPSERQFSALGVTSISIPEVDKVTAISCLGSVFLSDKQMPHDVLQVPEAVTLLTQKT